jgi:drug/metabolite transporter (DMT)-like permease
MPEPLELSAMTSSRRSNPAKGIALMALAMLTIPAVDGFAKYLSADYSPLFIGWARYAVASLVVLPVAVALRGTAIFPGERRISHVWRTVFLVSSMTLYFLAIARIPLATAISAFFVGPIVAVVLSVIVLKERLTAQKLLSLGLGVAGSLVILRPGGTIEPGVLLAIASGICFGLYLIATRQASEHTDPIKTLAFQCVVGTLLLMPQALATWSLPAARDLMLFAGMGLSSAITHMLSIAAFRVADASTLAPLVYLELIGAAIIGYLVFGDVPAPVTVIGAALIVAAGLVLLPRRSASVARQS